MFFDPPSTDSLVLDPAVGPDELLWWKNVRRRELGRRFAANWMTWMLFTVVIGVAGDVRDGRHFGFARLFYVIALATIISLVMGALFTWKQAADWRKHAILERRFLRELERHSGAKIESIPTISRNSTHRVI